MYIVIEGVDTAGKSTQLAILKKKYPDAIFTKEPGGTKIGLKLREMVLNGEADSKLAEMFLFLADRSEHVKKIIEPNSNKLIISDRGFLSGIAYAQTFSIETTIKLNLLALGDSLPQKIIILKLSQETLEFRLSQKKQDSIEKRGSQYLLDIQARMIKAIEIINNKLDNKIETLIIDASYPIEKIANQIENFIEN